MSAAQLRDEVATHFNVIPALAGRVADPLWPHPCEVANLQEVTNLQEVSWLAGRHRVPRLSWIAKLPG